jgi:hypothetical protein
LASGQCRAKDAFVEARAERLGVVAGDLQERAVALHEEEAVVLALKSRLEAQLVVKTHDLAQA